VSHDATNGKTPKDDKGKLFFVLLNYLKINVTRHEQPDRHDKEKEDFFHFLDFYFFFVIFIILKYFYFLEKLKR